MYMIYAQKGWQNNDNFAGYECYVGSFIAQQMLDDLMKTLLFLEVKEENLKDAIALHWKDYEDALQYCVALSNGIDYIVTNNKNDFEANEVPAVTPSEFMEIYKHRHTSQI